MDPVPERRDGLFPRRARAVVARAMGEQDEGIRQRIGDAIAEGQLPSLRRLADLAVRDDELVELLATQAGRRAWEFVVELYTRMGVREVPVSVWNGFQQKALGLASVYFAVLFQAMLVTMCLASHIFEEDHWALQPCVLAGVSFSLQVAIGVARTVRRWYPAGVRRRTPALRAHGTLLAHAVLHGLIWGLMGRGMAGRLLLQMVAVLGIGCLAAFINAASAAPGSDPKQRRHVRAWLSGWLVGVSLFLIVAPWLGSSRISALIVAAETLAVAAGSRERILSRLQQCKLDDAALVAMTAIGSLLAAVHGQLLLYLFWCLASSFLQSVMTTKVIYYVCINCAGAAALSRCLLQGQKDPWAHGGVEAALTR